jgi:hypothetical protein
MRCDLCNLDRVLQCQFHHVLQIQLEVGGIGVEGHTGWDPPVVGALSVLY